MHELYMEFKMMKFRNSMNAMTFPGDIISKIINKEDRSLVLKEYMDKNDKIDSAEQKKLSDVDMAIIKLTDTCGANPR